MCPFGFGCMGRVCIKLRFCFTSGSKVGHIGNTENRFLIYLEWERSN